MPERSLVHGADGTAEKSEAWRRDYNDERPHSAIGTKVPAVLMKLPDASNQYVRSAHGKSSPDRAPFG